MKRFVWIWGISALCACITIAAMSVMTRHVMRLEELSHTATREKEHAEKIRLALWRMESEASAFLLLENTRDAAQFLTISPDALPNHVRTYFQFNASGGFSCLSSATQVDKITLGTILNGATLTPCGLLCNATLANSMANRWSDNSALDLNAAHIDKNTPLQRSTEINSQTYEKAMRNEQFKRSISNVKGQNIKQMNFPDTQQTLIAGEFRPIWLHGELFLIRKLHGNYQYTLQGVWLQKGIIKEKLLHITKDLFTDAKLIPIEQKNSEHDILNVSSKLIEFEKMADDALALVSLPWRLSVEESKAVFTPTASAALTAMRYAWFGMAIALIAGMTLVFGLVRMSERRATFVSSVTHELRTPLTTFQLYSDLLASGMVFDEDKKKSYYETLRREADRLGYLVENVLAFAKVERGSARSSIKPCAWSDFMPAIVERMQQRLQQGGLELETHFDAADMAKTIFTDPVAVEHILFNLADNAAKYAHPHTCNKVILSLSQSLKEWTLTLRDFGPGIPRSEHKQIFRPFQKSKDAQDRCVAGVGLGLSLSKRLAKSINATLSYDSTIHHGAAFALKSPTQLK